jgi:hypothetical protein
MPLELGLGEIGDEVVLEVAGGFEVAGTAMGALLREDVVLDEDGARWGLRPKVAGVLTVFLAPAVGARGVGGIAAMDGASAALTDGLQLVLDLRQPAAQLRVLRLQGGDPLLEGGNEGQDGGLGLGRDVFQSGAGIGGGGTIPSITMCSYRRFGLGTPPELRSRDEALNSYDS